MERDPKPFVHAAVNAVDAVVFDPERRLDPERHDRYPSFEAARDAALSSIELMLDAADYDGEDHREELERMLGMLEAAASYEDLAGRKAYRWFLDRFDSKETRTVAA